MRLSYTVFLSSMAASHLAAGALTVGGCGDLDGHGGTIGRRDGLPHQVKILLLHGFLVDGDPDERCGGHRHNCRCITNDKGLVVDRRTPAIPQVDGTTLEIGLGGKRHRHHRRGVGVIADGGTGVDEDHIAALIVTVSTGNIRAYNELSTSQLPSGLYDVSVLAIVSIDQLTKFAQSKGMQAELSGATFAMNMKIRELNKKNEAEAIDHMVEKLKAIAKNGLFDYKLEIGEPFLNKNSNYCVEVDVYFHENDNTKAFYKTIYDTIDALSLTANEIKEYDKANLKYYCYNAQLIPKNGQPLYKLRNKYERIGNDTWEYPWLMPMLIKKALNYIIKDNLGHKWQCRYEKIEDQLIANWNYKKAFEKNNYICWYYEETIHRDTGKGYQKNGHYYTLSPTSRIMGISGEGRSNMLIPIKDYKTTDHDYLHLNPLEALGSYIRKEKRIYFEQRFLIEYTEEELSKLTSITIENKNE